MDKSRFHLKDGALRFSFKMVHNNVTFKDEYCLMMTKFNKNNKQHQIGTKKKVVQKRVSNFSFQKKTQKRAEIGQFLRVQDMRCLQKKSAGILFIYSRFV